MSMALHAEERKVVKQRTEKTYAFVQVSRRGFKSVIFKDLGVKATKGWTEGMMHKDTQFVLRRPNVFV